MKSFLMTENSFSIFTYRVYNQFDFDVVLWWCTCVRSSFSLLEKGICYKYWIFLAKLCFLLRFSHHFSITPGFFLLSAAEFKSPIVSISFLYSYCIDKLQIIMKSFNFCFLCICSRGKTRITIIFPWAQTYIILSFWGVLSNLWRFSINNITTLFPLRFSCLQ